MNPGVQKGITRIKKIIPKGSPLWLVYRYARNILEFNSGFPITVYLYKVHDNIVLHEYQAIYFPIPKVACSSLKKFCADTLDIEIRGKLLKEDIHYIQFPCVKKYLIHEKYKDYFKFCFVRNPWDRLVSCYMNKVFVDKDKSQEQEKTRFVKNKLNRKHFAMGMSFDDFIKAVCSIPEEKSEAHFTSQYIYVTDDDGKLLVDFVGRFENFNEDFAFVCQKIGISSPDLPHLMKSSHKTYREYYTKETREMVAERYKKDLEIFKFEF